MADSIEALVGYSQRDGEPPDPGEFMVPGYPDNRVVLHPTVIHDARKASPSLDREGFMVVHHETRYATERNREILLRDYQAEIAEFLKTLLGADHVQPFESAGLIMRFGARLIGRHALERPTSIIDERIPASFAHIDFLPGEPLPLEPGYSRFVVAQTWRAVSPPPQDVPLAICDRRTLDPADFSRRKGVLAPENAEDREDATFHIGGIHFNPAQRWWYFPDMEADELLVFTGYDSADPLAGRVAHAAFDNRHVHPDAHPRVSIEARFRAYYR